MGGPAHGAFVELFDLPSTGRGPLDGLRFGIKDIIDVAGKTSDCGNPMWGATHPPAAANAVCVEQLLAAGARGVGKTLTDELAFSLLGENPYFGTPLNPAAPDRVTGGSSSGSASAVACGLADFALGTDTGGSVRIPASNCGIFGYRPSHGAISVAGVMALAPSFDTVGVLAQDPQILGRVGAVLLGCELPARPAPSRIWLVKEAWDAVAPDVRPAFVSALEVLRTAFGPAAVADLSLRDVDGEPPGAELSTWLEAFCVVQWGEIWSTHGAWVEMAQPPFGPSAGHNFALVKRLDRRRIPLAIQKREALSCALAARFGPHDLLCYPTAPEPAPLLSSNPVRGQDFKSKDYYSQTISLTAIAGIGRLPQISLPAARAGEAPVGLSLVGARGADAHLLATVSAIGNLLALSPVSEAKEISRK
jgi:amidase